jgi:hypothetical protein
VVYPAVLQYFGVLQWNQLFINQEIIEKAPAASAASVRREGVLRRTSSNDAQMDFCDGLLIDLN